MNEERKRPDVGVVYRLSVLQDEEIADLKEQFNASGISFDASENDSMVVASLSFFVPLVEIILSPEFLQQVAIGILSSMAYEGMKLGVLKIWRDVTAKRANTRKNHQHPEEGSRIHFVGNGFSAVFPDTTDERIVCRFIDKAFDYLSHNNTNTKEYLVFENREICRYTEREMVEKAMYEHYRQDSIMMMVYQYICNNPNGSIQRLLEITNVQKEICMAAVAELKVRGVIQPSGVEAGQQSNGEWYTVCIKDFRDGSEFCACKIRSIITSDNESCEEGYWDTCCVCGKHLEDGFHYYNHYDGEDHDDMDGWE